MIALFGFQCSDDVSIINAILKQYFGQFLMTHRKIRVSGRLDNQAANRKSRVSDYNIKIVRTIA